MGEVDTKSIESVQAALYLFGQRSDSRRCRSTSSEEIGKDKELDLALKDLASYKLQLEIRESAHKQALLELEIYQKAAEELSSQLKKCEVDRDKYIKEYEEARTCIADLEYENKDILSQLLERREAEEEFQFRVEQKNTREESEVFSAEDESELNALRQCELMESAIEIEKEKTEELLKHESELTEAIHLLNSAVNEGEKDESDLILVKDERLQVDFAAAVQAQEQLEEMSKQLVTVKDSENRLQKQLQEMNKLMDQSLFVDSLLFELTQARESLECMGKDLKRTQEELKNVKEERDGLHHQLEFAMDETQKAKNEINEIQKREKDLQIEIAMLRSELHTSRAKTAAAEAAEARIKGVKSGLYLAVQELAIEAEEAKRENQKFKEAAERVGDIIETTTTTGESVAEAAAVGNADFSSFCSGITISMEEYNFLIQKAEKAGKLADPPSQDVLHLLQHRNGSEQEDLKEELEAARIEIDDLRCAAEQAARRAEQAESAKAAIENQLRKWREQKQKRRAALAAFREESSGVRRPPIYDNKHATYQPLGKALNIKF